MRLLLAASILYFSQLYSLEFHPADNPQKNSHQIQAFEISAVTYALDAGRFGDQVINYIKALWIAQKYNLQFLYKPFMYSEHLQCSLSHPHFSEWESRYKNAVTAKGMNRTLLARNMLYQIEKEAQDSARKANSIYHISFFTPGINLWEDESFRNLLAEFLRPIVPIAPMQLPQDMISIALHVRTGIGYDTPERIKVHQRKFPQDSYYIHALQNIIGIFEGQPLYIYIFTDHPEPISLVNKYSEALKALGLEKNVTMECRLEENRYDLNVLEDFFHMMQFDCVIRPDSSYSRAAAAISGPIVEICPPKRDRPPLNGPNTKRMYTDPNAIHIICRPEKGKNAHTSYIVPLI